MWKKGWTAYRLAKEAGLTEPTIHRMLKGQGSTQDTLEAVAKALGGRIVYVPPANHKEL